MRIALITDTHFGARNDSQHFSNYFKRFYSEVFFPYIDKHNIDTIFHLGDIVDRRKYINYLSARSLREDFIDQCLKRDIKLNIIIGNHDTYFRNTNEYNAMRELYSLNAPANIKWFENPEEVVIDKTKVLLVPWINIGNADTTLNLINTTKAAVCFGHLELRGFEMYSGSNIDIGMDPKIFDRFDTVLTGHYHHKSTIKNINYLGAPYEITWADYNDDRGFHIFDTSTLELEFVKNPLTMFNKIEYDDTGLTTKDIVNNDVTGLAGTYCKVLVKNKTNNFLFDLFIDQIEKAGVVEVQIIDDTYAFDNLNDLTSDTVQDTISFLQTYIDNLKIDVNKDKLETLLKQLYDEAQNIER